MNIANRRLLVFLCTGNYYRSRFAEILFNHEVARAGLAWWAISRGLGVGRRANAGEISPWAVLALARRGIPVGGHRAPMQAAERELEAAERVVAMREAEHRLLLETGFPGWANRVEYWNVRDVEPSLLHDPLAVIEANVRALIRRIQLGSDPASWEHASDNAA